MGLMPVFTVKKQYFGRKKTIPKKSKCHSAAWGGVGGGGFIGFRV
jgi:hypothetical protein